MPRRPRQLRVRNPDVFLLLPATPLAHRHARILRTIPVDHTIFSFRYTDLHHRLLSALRLSSSCMTGSKSANTFPFKEGKMSQPVSIVVSSWSLRASSGV